MRQSSELSRRQRWVLKTLVKDGTSLIRLGIYYAPDGTHSSTNMGLTQPVKGLEYDELLHLERLALMERTWESVDERNDTWVLTQVGVHTGFSMLSKKDRKAALVRMMKGES